jgi:hypothetical protein
VEYNGADGEGYCGPSWIARLSSLTLYIFYACQGMMTNTSNLWSALPGTKLLGTVAEIQDFFNFNALIDCRAARDHKIS